MAAAQVLDLQDQEPSSASILSVLENPMEILPSVLRTRFAAHSSRRQLLAAPGGLAWIAANWVWPSMEGSQASPIAAKAGAKPAATVKTSKPHVNVGTLGQFGKGKTTLASAITKVLSEENGRVQFRSYEWILSAKEKKPRLPLELTFVEYETTTRHYAHADCVGHADHIKSLIAGVAVMDGAILVVAAGQGITAETREHVRLARQVGIPAIVVALNKAEIAREGELKRLEGDVRNLLNSQGYRGQEAPVAPVSASLALKGEAKWKQSLQELMRAADAHIPLPTRDRGRPLLMPVEDAFSIAGRGTVATGRIEQGMVKAGDKVELVGMGETRGVVVTGCEMFKKPLDVCAAGDNVGLLLRDIDKAQVMRGQVIAKPGSIAGRKRFRAEVYMLTQKEGGRGTPFSKGYRPQFYFRTTDVTGVATLPNGVERVAPGEHVLLEIELAAPVAMERGLRFAIREGGWTVGAGVVVDAI